ncbi:hypothetical protein O5O45_26975 [Hahella aquimaris]|uniref:hypothetical protein n=1 Tax=Hahella sp. HNIBRBA332 TaxID=3015983 RepID=UPI00273C1BDA|nr:hypothetical protein [Hahella sp. HNIBRBA332]WLQ13372.1 hypothetical protein O5O45_26975 [Hahella sp. HNIBRBA332]
MRWLKRLKASKLNPMGPDFSTAPWIDFDLSGRKLKFRCPHNEMSGPVQRHSKKINIYQDEDFEHWNNETGMSVDLLSTGWKFWDRPYGEGALGYLLLELRLHRRDPHYRKIDSMLNQKDMEQWLLAYADGVWGVLNRDLDERAELKVRPIIPEKDYWRYPGSSTDIKSIFINNIQWYSYTAELPSSTKWRLFHTPISEDHELTFSFIPSAIGRNYYKDDHDLDGAVERTVHEFIENVHIKLD